VKNNMYKDVKTWNPQVGCKFDCTYCKPSFQRIVKWSAGMRDNCSGCKGFRPHQHEERMDRIPGAGTVFVCGNGDISFAKPVYVRKIISAIQERITKHPDQQFYFQSKNPKCFEQYLCDFPKDNTILLTTLETNRDEGYNQISKAPVPSKRYADFKAVAWHRKIVTIEPILDFDQDVFLRWIQDIGPEAVYIGYNSRPEAVQLPEPDQEKVDRFIAALKDKNITVKEKTMRR